jgi:hypothetical protein
LGFVGISPASWRTGQGGFLVHYEVSAGNGRPKQRLRRFANETDAKEFLAQVLGPTQEREELEDE